MLADVKSDLNLGVYGVLLSHIVAQRPGIACCDLYL